VKFEVIWMRSVESPETRSSALDGAQAKSAAIKTIQ
jgi:hypothetical protein